MKIINGYCLFWREFLSNWQISNIKYDGLYYNCVEHIMMAEKARAFKDTKTLNKILLAKHPKEQKELGRQVKNYNDEKWANLRYNVVLQATLAKYRQNPTLKERLLSINCDAFVEASPEDTIWGIGMDEDHPNAGDPAKWKGKNLLGKVITEARNILRNE